MAEILLIGHAASPGLAIGPVTMLTAAVARRTASDDPAQEAAALRAAIEGARAEITEQIKTIQGEVADILEFQVAMLEDDTLADPAYEVISVDGTVDVIEHRKMEPVFYLADDPLVRKRVLDAQGGK